MSEWSPAYVVSERDKHIPDELGQSFFVPRSFLLLEGEMQLESGWKMLVSTKLTNLAGGRRSRSLEVKNYESPPQPTWLSFCHPHDVRRNVNEERRWEENLRRLKLV